MESAKVRSINHNMGALKKKKKKKKKITLFKSQCI